MDTSNYQRKLKPEITEHPAAGILSGRRHWWDTTVRLCAPPFAV